MRLTALSWPGSDQVTPQPIVKWLDFDWQVMMGQGFVENFYIRHFVTAKNLSDAVATLSKIIQCTNRDKSHVI